MAGLNAFLFSIKYKRPYAFVLKQLTLFQGRVFSKDENALGQSPQTTLLEHLTLEKR